MMLINPVEMDSVFRGKGIAKEAILEVVKKLGTSCDLRACKPFPLQFERTAEEHSLELRAAQKGLESFGRAWVSYVSHERIASSDRTNFMFQLLNSGKPP